MPPDAVEDVDDAAFTQDDWYGEELTGQAYRRCTFTSVDLTEAVIGQCTFTDCTFGDVRFNAARLADSALLGCTFAGCNFFDAEFTGCKLSGSRFERCALRPLRVLGGDWSFVVLPGADLRGSDLSAVDPLAVELTDAVITPEQAVVIAQTLGLSVR